MIIKILRKWVNSSWPYVSVGVNWSVHFCLIYKSCSLVLSQRSYTVNSHTHTHTHTHTHPHWEQKFLKKSYIERYNHKRDMPHRNDIFKIIKLNKYNKCICCFETIYCNSRILKSAQTFFSLNQHKLYFPQISSQTVISTCKPECKYILVNLSVNILLLMPEQSACITCRSLAHNRTYCVPKGDYK